MTNFNLRSNYYFGTDAIDGLIIELKKNNFQKPMILYGFGSIKENGIYQNLVKLLKTNNFNNFVEFSKIEPNPREKTVMNASIFARENNVDVIIAVGGGSVIDASKVIGILANNPQYSTAWEYVLDQSKISKNSIPIISIITLAGTASENNSGSVITNYETKEKCGVFTPSANPIVTIENPEYTFSVNKYQTACGIFDCFSHLLEQFFGKFTFDWTKEIIFANMRVLLKHAKNVIENPSDYSSRANILWTTSMSLNGMTSFESDSDWSVHTIEHAFSGLWNIAHGAGLALITPYYLYERSKSESWFEKKLIELGKNIFGVNSKQETIDSIIQFIKDINLFTKWKKFNEIKDFTIHDEKFLLDHCMKFTRKKEMMSVYASTISLIRKNK